MINMLFIAIHLFIHPFHVSVSDIKYKEKQKAIQISMRIFLDDLELGLQTYTGNNKLDIIKVANTDFLDKILKKYMTERIKMWDSKNKMYDIKYIGAEIENDVMWTYLEIEKVKKLKRIKIHNSVLHEIWGSQENLIHFRAFDEVQSIRLYKGESEAVFTWK